MIQQILSKIIAHKAGIMLGGAAVGVVVTAVLAAKDARKYDDEIAIKGEDILENMTDKEYDEYMDCQDENTWRHAHVVKTFATKKERAIIFAKSYWRTGLSMAVTFGLMILSHRSMVKELAATAAALGVMSTKYQELASTLKEKYPDTYNKVMTTINKRNARNAIEKDKHAQKEPKDDKHKYYEPITKQVFYATRDQIFDAERYLTDLFLDDGVATIGQLILYLKEHVDKHLKYKFEYDKIGWSPFDDSFLAAANDKPGHASQYVRINPSEDAQIIVNGKKHFVKALLYSVYPYIEPGEECVAE